MSRPTNFNVSNTLITTKLGSPIVSKTGNIFSIYPSHTSPYADARFITNPTEYGSSSFGRPVPIKHWRRQLIRVTTSTSGGGGVAGSTRGKITLRILDAPGGTSIRTNGSCASDTGTNGTFNNAYVSTDSAVTLSPGEGSNVTTVYNPGYVSYGNKKIYTGIYNTKRVGPCPQLRPVNTGSTLLSKAYYSDSRALLHARGRTFDQNSRANIEICVRPEYQDTAGAECFIQPVVKPNNTPFKTQGAVSSGLRMERLKQTTITKNGNSFLTAYGLEAANAGKYHGSSFTPYFIKNKMQTPICSTAGLRIREHALVCPK
jgi:hypothetical protein